MKPAKRGATYQDVLDAPEHHVAEIVDGDLYVSPRPRVRHARAASILGMLLGPPYHLQEGGPGGWEILDEPELHLGPHVLVPDLAGWRYDLNPELDLNVASFATLRVAPSKSFAAMAGTGPCSQATKACRASRPSLLTRPRLRSASFGCRLRSESI